MEKKLIGLLLSILNYFWNQRTEIATVYESIWLLIFDVPAVLDVANSYPDNTCDTLISVFDKETIRKIETITKDESENPEWYNHWKGRIIASKMFIHMKL